MYSVSQAYINKLKEISEKRRRIRGSIGSVSFTENDILDGSFSYTDIAVKSADIKLGGVFVGSLQLTFLNSFISSIPRGSWRGRTISNLSVGLYLGKDEHDAEIWEDVPLKPFIIDEANHSALGIDIVAYDAMSKFDSTIQLTTTSGDLFGMATLACSACGVTLGMTSTEMGALPNGTETFSLYAESDIETWRDLISWIGVTVGGFAAINRSGELVFRTWKNTADIEIGVNDRFEGGQWSDFATNYTAVQLTNMADNTPLYYALEVDDGLTMNIGANPLLQYGLPTTRETQARAILTAIQNLKYTPFSSTSLIDPALDLGDVILYSDGIANNAKCCVMRIDFSFQKGATVKGYGKNPSLNGARSAQDKAISQAAKGSTEQNFTYYTFINSAVVNLTTRARKIYKIAFASSDKTTVELWHEIKWNNVLSGSTQTITYEYYLDDTKFDYEPTDCIGENGLHTIAHPYWLLDVEAGTVHHWEVRAKVNSGTATASIGDVHAILKGQRLVGEVVGGDIEIEEEIEPMILGRLIVPLTDSAIEIETSDDFPHVQIHETQPAFMLGRLIVPLVENMEIHADSVQYTRITEEGETRITEDGSVRVTEV